jgi:hypothetical protein
VKRSRETVVLILLLILGLAPRLAFVCSFPTIPISDFNALVGFGLHLRDHGLISHTVPWLWESFNVGLPLVLCGLFRIAAGVPPTTMARLATAFACGLLPVLPFLIWRRVLPFWVRVLAAASLALWPGQILFSGVVAQDNWVLLPSVALGALAVRTLIKSSDGGDSARPITAGLLYAAGVAIRQEMLIALLPLLLVAAGLTFRAGWRRVAAATLAAGLPLLALAVYRDAATGRFAVTTAHGGITILGSYIPGAAANGWSAPYSFIASTRPDLLRDRKAMFSQASGLAVREALRRPAFHAARILSSAVTSAVSGEAGSLYWSVGAPEALPEPLRERGAALETLAARPLLFELAALQGLFLAAVVIGVWRRNPAILALVLAVLLKYGLHAVTTALGRHFFVATALEILTIAIAAYEVSTMTRPAARLLLARAVAVGIPFGVVLFLCAPRLAAFVQSRDVDPHQRAYHFFLQPPGLPWHETSPPNRYTELACVVDRGRLLALWPGLSATLRTLQRDPAPGDQAVAVCELTGQGEPRPLMLQVLDPSAPGGLGGRMLQRIEVDGVEVFSHDFAQTPWIGSANIPLGNVGTGTKRSIVIEVKAINPDPGAGWGDNAQIAFQLAGSSPLMNQAMGKPTAQSSTLSGAAPGPGGAVDGNTDGNFYHGSVTSTNANTNSWWQVDLLTSISIGSIAIWNRTDCCSDRLEDYWVFVSDTPFSPTDTPATLQSRPGIWSSHQKAAPHPSVRIMTPGTSGRYIRVQLTGTGYLSLAEVQVFSQ